MQNISIKNKLRQYALEKRKSIDTMQCSKQILENLFSIEEYQKSKNILCYYPLKYEADVRPCFEDTNKKWFLPRVKGKNLEICPYCKEKLSIGSFNICEPQTEELKTKELIDMIIIPAVAADRNGCRIGYGKGYYDRFLFSLTGNPIKVLLVYSDLLFPCIYPEQFDIRADIVVTDKEILRF